MRKSEHIREILSTLPTSPGVYQYFDSKGDIIYVGKAKNLKRRVSSYFNKEQSGKVGLMVSRIADIRFFVVDTESDALLLENNLIKSHKPRYNILLKDDKTYPWICIKNEAFPRVFLTRRKINDGSAYFGPYPSVTAINTLLEIIKKIYPLRTCKLNLSDTLKPRFRACLEYHIGNCKAPCTGGISAEDYDMMIQQIKNILNGKINIVLKGLKDDMMAHADKLEFEEAQKVKEKYDLLEGYRSRSVVVTNQNFDVDAFSFDDAGESFYVNRMKVKGGSVVQTHNMELKRRLDETPAELLQLAIAESLQHESGDDMREILVPVPLEFGFGNIKTTVPKRGDKLNILNLSTRNAQQYRAEMEKIRSLADPERHKKRVLGLLQDELHLPQLPNVIECFDNSNFQGDYAVASMVQFVGGKPNKSEYRHFNIKTVSGPDDYASMKEVVRRRYSRLLDEGKPLPDLIITDGGLGQMEVVRQVVCDELKAEIPIAGLAKDDRHRTNELLYGFPPRVVGLKTNSELFRLLAHIQDEAHRFAITHHRSKFAKGFIHSEIDEIKGIGKTTKDKLLKQFKSPKHIAAADLDTLVEAVGKAKAELVYKHFHEQQN